jgi:D-xylono/L-arabinono-1,4-lactonase
MTDQRTQPLPEPELVADTRCHTGEGPLWHPDERAVYWVDIPAGRLLRYDPASGEHEAVYEHLDGAIGGATLQADGSLLLFLIHGAIGTWTNGRLTQLREEIPEERDGRFNDVIADPEGRVFCGTMPIGDRPGRLYRLDPDLRLHLVLEDAGVSNGMGFTPDLSAMYHTDTAKGLITRFDYDRATGALTNRRVFLEAPAGDGLPDGLTVDANGDVWSARWDGSALVKHSPAGQDLLRIPFPAKKVSSIAFGGPDYDEAYVTTAGGRDRRREGPGAGALFRVRPGVRGVPEFRSRIGL